MLGLYGARDSGIPLVSVETRRAALAQGRSGSAFAVHPDDGHGFYGDYRPSYVEADARDGFARALAWLTANGAAWPECINAKRPWFSSRPRHG